MAYVKISDVKEIIERYSEHCFLVNDAKGQDIADKILDEVMELPAADVCEVVRCKDCKYSKLLRNIDDDKIIFVHCRVMNCFVKSDSFCSYGERKEGDA